MNKNLKTSILDNKTYYDTFSENYENGRDRGYHKMLDDLEASIVLQYTKKHHSILEVGCGTGLILKRVSPFVAKSIGVDISEGMLLKAKEKGLDVYCCSAELMPFENDTFDIAYSFKVLPHIENIDSTLKEISRVLKPNGIAVLEFYNPNSIRGFLKKIKKPTSITTDVKDTQIFTRYDSLKDIKNLTKESWKLEGIHGVRIFSASYLLYKIPFIKEIFWNLEKYFHKSILSKFGGFLIVILKNEKENF
jgi:ubiquinone/menaquinone biosynthesis C-methylase UbiE